MIIEENNPRNPVGIIKIIANNIKYFITINSTSYTKLENFLKTKFTKLLGNLLHINR